MDGKRLRLRRIVDTSDGRTVILPLDHGLSMGPILGLVSPAEILQRVCRAAPDALVLHKGLLRFIPPDLDPAVGIIVHLSAGTELGPPARKVLVTGVDEALAMGADAVSVHINFGGTGELEMLRDLGRVSDRCISLGMPLLAMTYLRGGTVAEKDPRGLALAARAAAELGADLVKLPWPDSYEAMVDVVAGCPAGVVLAGGPRNGSDQSLEQRVKVAISAGAIGVAAGRNVFQAANPAEELKTLMEIVHPSRREAWVWTENRRSVGF